METVAGTVDNDIISDAILMSRAAIREGDTIADPLAASKMFPPMVVQMITIGEETGQLDSMLSEGRRLLRERSGRGAGKPHLAPWSRC